MIVVNPRPTIQAYIELVYNQNTPADEWDIAHNLNRYPTIIILDDNGNLIEGDIEYIDLNNILLSFSKSITGKAILR